MKFVYILIALAVLATSSLAQQYFVTDLGPGKAWAINSQGQVVGESPEGAFFWENGTRQLIGEPGSAARDIDDFGRIVGYNSTPHAWLRLGSQVFFLEDPNQWGDSSQAFHIATTNSGGYRIAGNWSTHLGDWHNRGFVWTNQPGNPYQGEMQWVPNSTLSRDVNINNWSLIGGSIARGNDQRYLAGIDGRAINDHGQFGWVVGEMSSHAYIWPSSDNLIDIGAFEPTNINQQDLVVGSSSSGAVFWNGISLVGLGGHLVNGSGWQLTSATSLNDGSSPSIVGYGTLNGVQHAFLLTPVPEPATICILGFGLAFIARRSSTRLRRLGVNHRS